MTTEEAIKTIETALAQVEWEYPMDYAAAFDVAIAALRAQQEAEKNEPLTLEELREMDGQPVWLNSLGENFDNGWYIIVAVDRDRIHCLQLYTMLLFEHYGKTWLAYRHKPKEG